MQSAGATVINYMGFFSVLMKLIIYQRRHKYFLKIHKSNLLQCANKEGTDALRGKTTRPDLVWGSTVHLAFCVMEMSVSVLLNVVPPSHMYLAGCLKCGQCN